MLDFSYQKVLKITNQLKELGFTIAIDDFGKGASNLARLRELDVDELKLDREFICYNETNLKGRYVLQSVISMASNLSITCLAEGIETKEQLAMLKEYGCQLGQGYYFSKSLPLPEFETLIVENDNKKQKSSEMNRSILKYWNKFEDLHYGVAIVANDKNSTVLHANSAFYNIIGYTKEIFKKLYANHMTEILVDNLYTLVKKYLDEKQYNFSYDLRILNGNGNISWVHDIVEYDPKNNLFVISLIDITEKNKDVSNAVSYEEYTLEKEIVKYVGDFTSDYIYITDVNTDKLIYLSKNSIDLLGYKGKDEWYGVEYYKIIYGLDKVEYSEFYDNLNDKTFSTREYFNEHMQMYLRIKVKLFDFNGKMCRLHIVTDITSQRSVESELELQLTLIDCVEELYNSDNSRIVFTKLLEHIQKFYGGENTYYFKLNREEKSIDEIVSFTKEECEDQSDAIWTMPIHEQVELVSIFEKAKSNYFTIDELLNQNFTPTLLEIVKESNLRSILLAPIKDEDNNSLGFIGIANPAKNYINSDLIKVLSRFIIIFNRKDELKKLEYNAHLVDDKLKLGILSNCSDLLQFTCDTNIVFLNILKLLRQLYASSHSMLFNFVVDNLKLDLLQQDYDEKLQKLFNLDDGKYIDTIKELCKKYSQNSCDNIIDISSNSLLSLAQKEMFAEYGLFTVYLSPILGIDGETNGFLVLINPEVTIRSTALLQVVTKYISDFNKMKAIQNINDKELELDPLSRLYNKISTNKNIENLLKHGCVGAIYMVDIDTFKSVNDMLGHDYGAQVIIDVAHAINGIFRKEDIVGRIGGDEFMVFCPNIESKETIVKKGAMIVDALRRTYSNDGNSVNISASVGICVVSELDKDFMNLYKKVDKALYEAKFQGKNCYILKE